MPRDETPSPIGHADRFAGWTRLPAVLLLLAVIGLMTYGAATSHDLVDRTKGVSANRTDAALYVAVDRRVADGQDYYAAVAAEHRARGYPLRPFVTVREPTLAYATAAVGGPDRMKVVLGGLALITAGLLVWRLEGVATGRPSWWSSAVVVAVCCGGLVGHTQAVTHEVWAGMLIALSLAVRGPRRHAASVALGLLAVLVRELALPYLVVMVFLAWREKRTREAMAWLASIVVFAVAYSVHALLVLGQTGTADRSSQGWFSFGGWPFIVDLMRRGSFLGVTPGWVAGVLVPLALIGWLSRNGALANRIFLAAGTFIVTFMVIGRPENVYWGLLFVLVLIPGVAFAPRAVSQLVRASIGSSERPRQARENA